MSKRLKLGYIFLLIFASIPVFAPFLIQMEQGHDLFFHLMRIEGLTQGIRDGQFPVRIQPGWYQGYGYGVSVFYGDIFLYIPAILHLIGMSLQNSYKVYIVLSNAATIAIAGYSFKGIFKNDKVAFLGSMFYTLSIYRLMNVYIRDAVGEYTAMIFMPLLAYAFYCIVYKEKERRKGMILLAVGMAGVIQSHIISAEICVAVLCLSCVVCMRRVWNLNVIWIFCKSALLAVGLSLGFLVPFVDYMINGSFNANVASSYKMEKNIGEHGTFIRQLFQVFYEATGANQPKSAGIIGEMPLGVGLTLGFAIVLWIVLEVYSRKEKNKPAIWNVGRVTTGFSILFLWMTTIYFPWEFLRKSNKLFRYMIVNIQFPWRLLTVSTLFLVMLWCALGIAVTGNFSVKIIKSVTIGACVLTLLSSAYMLGDALVSGNKAYVHSVEAMGTSVASGEEYLPYATVSSELVPDKVDCTDNLNCTDYSKSGLSVAVKCENNSSDMGILTLPLLYYEGYRCSDESVELTMGWNNKIALTIPGEYSGQLEVSYKEPVYWKLSTIISVMIYIVLCGWCIIQHRNTRPKQLDN